MKIKVKKSVLKYEYDFYLHLISRDTMKCNFTVIWSKDKDIYSGTLSEDYSKFTFDIPIELQGYSNDTNPPKKLVKWLKIDTYNKRRIKDYYEWD